MIKVSVLYPHAEGSSFDMKYYCESHIPMVLKKLGTACKGGFVDQGVGGAVPGAPPAFVAMGHLLFESVDTPAAQMANLISVVQSFNLGQGSVTAWS